MVVAFCAGIPLEFTQEAGVVPCHRCSAIRTPFQSPHTTRREVVCVFYSPPIEEVFPSMHTLTVVISAKWSISWQDELDFGAADVRCVAKGGSDHLPLGVNVKKNPR